MTLTDDRTAGLTTTSVDPLRYENSSNDPFESSGKTLGMIPAGARVLDVGCGTGWLAQLIRDEREADVVGIEPHPVRAGAARSRGLTVHTGELTRQTLEALGTFDVILFADVIEHLVSPEEVLRLAAGGLRPNGSVIASTPNIAHWTVRLSLLAGNFNYTSTGIMDATHLRWFTTRTVRQLFESAGMRVAEYMTSAGTWMRPYCRRPLTWLPATVRRGLIHRCSQQMPGLFGCQHIVRGVLR